MSLLLQSPVAFHPQSECDGLIGSQESENQLKLSGQLNFSKLSLMSTLQDHLWIQND